MAKKKTTTKQTVFEKTWKPVQLKETGSGAAARARSNKGAWFDKATILSAARKQRLDEFKAMDGTCIDVARALDILGEDVSSDNITDTETIIAKWHDDKNPKKQTIETVEEALRQWMRHTGLDKRLFDHLREALKFGAKFFMRNADLTWKPMIPENIVGYVLDKDDPTKVTHYLYQDRPFENEEGDQVSERKDVKSNSHTNEADKVPIKDMIILKNGDRPYGKSVLENVYKTWKILKMLEAATVIYRIVRAPERRVWYIDTGRASGPKAAAYVEEVKRRITSRQYVNGGEIDTQYNPASMQEDFFLAANGENRSSRVETLPGGDSLGEMGDVQYFNKKLSMGFRIPPSYMDSYSDNLNGETHNDGRLGTAYIAEVRYAGYVRRLQREFDDILFDEFKAYCKKNGVKLPEDEFVLEIKAPQAFEVYRETELAQARLNVYQQAENMQGLSKRYALQKYLGLEADELAENEEAKLLEKGYSKAQIRKLKDHERMSLIYGQEVDGFGGGFGAGSPGQGGMADFAFSGGKPDTAIPLPDEDMPPPEAADKPVAGN